MQNSATFSKFSYLNSQKASLFSMQMGQIQDLRFCDRGNLADIFSCPEFPVVRLDNTSGFSEWTANVLS